MPPLDTPTPCFVSYRRQDDDQLGGVVSRIAQDIAVYFSATTGKSLQVFMDRHDIGWGDDWRERISESVANATVFIPVVTMRYFESQHCSEELMTFYSNAHQLSVTELILPIVVLGAENIRADDPREEVRLIERLQYENIREAWLAGYDSGEWRLTMSRLSERLQAALANAEALLSEPPARPDTGTAEPIESTADLTALEAKADEIAPLITEIMEPVGKFFDVVNEDLVNVDWPNMSAGQRNARFLAAASRLKPLSEEIETKGDRLSAEVSAFDADLRAIVRELRSINDSSSMALLQSMLAGATGFRDVEQIGPQIDGIVNVLKTTSLLNVQLRRAIRPGITGLSALKTAMATVSSWSALL